MVEISNKTNLTDKEIEEIIEKFYKDKSDKTKNFIRLSIRKFGDIYDYSKTNRVDSNLTKVIITCPIHGDFLVDPLYFSTNKYCKGCPVCNPPKTGRSSLPIFMEKLHKIFPHYSEIPGRTVYVNNWTDIELHCDIHNIDFKARPSNLLNRKNGCPECNSEKTKNTRLTSEAKKFKERVEVLSDKYEFGEYHGAEKDVEIRCRKHNFIFYLTPNYLYSLIKSGETEFCPKCKEEERSLLRTKNFIEKCEDRYPGRFDYSEIKYINNTVPVEGIRCNHCGKSFSIYPSNFLHGHGCPICNKSEGEILIEEWAVEAKNCGNIDNFSEHCKFSSDIIEGRKSDWGVEIDFIIVANGKEYWIEYSGEQHYVWCTHFHKTIDIFENQLKRDRNVREFCKNNSKVLIEIPWTFPRIGIKDLLSEIILHGVDPQSVITLPEISYTRIKEKGRNGNN